MVNHAANFKILIKTPQNFFIYACGVLLNAFVIELLTREINHAYVTLKNLNVKGVSLIARPHFSNLSASKRIPNH